MDVVEARGVRKRFGSTVALDGLDFRVGEGRVLGVVGANGAGKSTALHAILGLTHCEGALSVLGRDPWSERARLMRDVAFVADVAVLPRWARVSRLIDFVAGVHPRFDRARVELLLAETGVTPSRRVRELSKGMVAQLHLALAMAVEARLLVLDEPTLGLDVLYRKRFYDALLADCYDRGRTVVVATHEVAEIQGVLTDVLILDRGRAAIACAVDELASRFAEVTVRPEFAAAARALGPIAERRSLGASVMTFDGADPRRLGALGDVRTPGVADVFAALVGERDGRAREAAR